MSHGLTDHFAALANAPMAENRPTPETTKVLEHEADFYRFPAYAGGEAALAAIGAVS